MSKRISPEQHVIAFFMTASPSACQTMFETIKAMARIRGQEAALAALASVAKPAERRKRSRKPPAPKPLVTPAGPSAQNKQTNRDYVEATNEAAS